eukprot:714887-Prymnesium_polylepis.1
MAAGAAVHTAAVRAAAARNAALFRLRRAVQPALPARGGSVWVSRTGARRTSYAHADVFWIATTSASVCVGLPSLGATR